MYPCSCAQKQNFCCFLSHFPRSVGYRFLRRILLHLFWHCCFLWDGSEIIFFSYLVSNFISCYVYVALLWQIVFGVVQPSTPTLTAIFDIIGTVETTVVMTE
jgi:hypothetical protein